MTDWEQRYLDNETPWNKNLPSPPLEAWVSRNLLQGRALVPGCGIGHDVVMLAQHGLQALGLDIAPTAVRQAQCAYPHLHSSFHCGDLFATPEAWQGSFDFIFEHTCLCALPPSLRLNYESTAFSLLKPGGLLVGIWFIHPEMDPGEEGPPFALPINELDALFPSSRWQVEDDYQPQEAFPGRHGRERLRALRKRT